MTTYQPTGKQPQPHCPFCGRFAYWSREHQEWRLRCIGVDAEGVADHE